MELLALGLNGETCDVPRYRVAQDEDTTVYASGSIPA